MSESRCSNWAVFAAFRDHHPKHLDYHTGYCKVAEQPVREADVLCGTGACESCQSRKGQPDRNAEKNSVASEPPPPCGYFRKYEGRPTHGTCAGQVPCKLDIVVQ